MSQPSMPDLECFKLSTVTSKVHDGRPVLIPALTSRRRRAMALAALSGDEQCIIFVQLCNTLDPGVAVAFGSINSELGR